MSQSKLEERKKKLLRFFNSPEYVPMRKREIAGLLQVPAEDKEALSSCLERMIFDGTLSVDTKGRYHREKNELVTGVFQGTQKEFGFLLLDNKEEIFIEAGHTLGAMNKDTVQAVLLPVEEMSGERKREGRIVKILTRANQTIVGTFFAKRDIGYVISEDKRLGRDLFIDKKNRNGAVTGSKVVAVVTDFGDGTNQAKGKITEILGHIDDPESDLATILKAFHIEADFPEEVLSETERIPEFVTEEAKKGRLDLRDYPMITIDGEDAKDLDDAVSLLETENGYELSVHIADVSEYVKEKSFLDQEALRRGTSVYLINKVVPMLPHRLSNGICSLNAGEDRLALSCLMELDQDGTIVGHRIAETLIHVDKRCSYNEIAALLSEEETEEQKQCYGRLLPMIHLMKKVSLLLRKKREKRGAIDFDFPESKIIVDEHGFPIEIKPYDRNEATKIIEDFMLAANETVAEDFYWQEVPFVYRVHEAPEEEKITRLSMLLQNFGYSLHVANKTVNPKTLQKLLQKASDSPEEAMISRLTLRSMRQARYMVTCEGHFGLATKYYCHFTSPIRRYPDLQIHRIIKERLRGKLSESRELHYRQLLTEVAEHSSKTERTADEAEREIDKMKKCEYAEKHIGEEFTGYVSGLTSYGMYVELLNTVEGMIRLSDLTDDYYVFDEANYRLTGQRGRRVFQLGQRVTVSIARVDKILKAIDFFPVSL